MICGVGMDQCFNVLDKLAKSKFRSKFKLRAKELEYINDKGLDSNKYNPGTFLNGNEITLNNNIISVSFSKKSAESVAIYKDYINYCVELLNKEIKNNDQGKTLATKLQNGISIRFRSVQDRFAVDFDIWQIEECMLLNRYRFYP